MQKDFYKANVDTTGRDVILTRSEIKPRLPGFPSPDRIPGLSSNFDLNLYDIQQPIFLNNS